MPTISQFGRKTANTIAAAVRLYFEPLIAHNVDAHGARVPESPTRHIDSVWRAIGAWPIAAACALGLASFLSVSYLRLQTVSAAQRAQLMRAEAQLRASVQHEQELAGQVSQLQDRLALVIQVSPERQQRPGLPKQKVLPVERDLAVVDAVPALDFQSNTLGAEELKREDLRLSVPVPGAKIRVDLREVRNNAIIDVLIVGDIRIERPNVPVEGQGVEKHISVNLSPQEVKLLLNRQVSLTVTDRGHATIGTTMITLRLQ